MFFYGSFTIFYIIIAKGIDNTGNSTYNDNMIKYTLDKQLGFKHPEWEVDFSIWTGSPTLLHDHCYFELFIVTNGSLTHICNGQKEYIECGQVRFIRPTDCHRQSTKNKQPTTTINLSFTSDFLNECESFSNSAFTLLDDESPRLFTLDKTEFAYVMFLSEKIINASSKEAENKLIKQVILLCLNKLPSAKKTQNNYPAWIQNLFMQLQDPKNFIYPLSDLTKQSHYSNTTLALEFKKYAGCTAVQFFRDAKLRYACQLLKNTDYTTLKIANECGYFSLSHFNHIFKTFKGISPIEYRKKHQPAYKIKL